MISILTMVLLAFLVLVIMQFVTFSKLSGLRQRIFDLEDNNIKLKQLVEKFVEGKELHKPKESVDPTVEKTSQPLQSQEPTKSEVPKDGKTEPENEKVSSTPQSTTQVKPDTVQTSGNLEENIASKWFVWIGAGAIALSGLFLVKYIAEQGILTPAVRMVLAFAMGIALAIGGEWVRRKPIQKAIANLKPNYIPMALTASGLFTMFASVYAAFALYHLLPALIAFALMAAVSVLAFGLSVLQGVSVAVLGLVGALITPVLIQTGNPSVLGLFGYLSIVITSCVAVLRYRPWWWLGLIAVAGSGVWVVVWTATNFRPGDEIVLGLFLGLVVVMFSLLVRDDDEGTNQSLVASAFTTVFDLKGYRITALAAGAVAGLVYLAPLTAGKGSDQGLIILAVLLATISALAYIRPNLRALLIPTFLTLVLAFILWGLATHLSVFKSHKGMDLSEVYSQKGLEMVMHVLQWAAGFASAFALVGFFVAARRTKPLLWILISILTPLALLIITYVAFGPIYPDRNWAAAGLVLALAALLAAILTKRGMKEGADNLLLGLYAAAVVSGLSLTFVFLLQDAWLTVALSLQLPAIAWLSNHLKLDFLRKVAMVMVLALFARLALNPFLFEYAKTHYLGEHWVLYGYGIPAVAAHFAAVWFKHRADDRLVTMLEGLRIVFAVLLISGELRILATGNIDTPRLSLLEGGMQSIAWLAVAWSRLRQFTIDGRLMDKWSGLILFAMGSAMALVGNLIIHNPAFNSEHVGNATIFNTLLLAFAIPAILMWVNSRLPLKQMSKSPNNTIIGISVLVLLFSYITLETRHAFQGGVLAFARPSEAEVYTYSVVWLVFAFALLMYGLLKKRVVARYAALLVLVITVLKVFLSDMSGLEGLWRVASFLGLGLSLVAIGYLYQRFLYLPNSRAKSMEKDTKEPAPTK